MREIEEVKGAADAVSVTMTARGRRLVGTTYFYDKAGKTLLIMTPKHPNEVAATFSQIQKAFPQAAEQIRAIARARRLLV